MVLLTVTMINELIKYYLCHKFETFGDTSQGTSEAEDQS
jgi:hypothetical protein